MSPIALNLAAISVFVMTLSVLLGPLLHIPAAVPAIVVLGGLGLATVDTFSWQGQGGTIALDWLASFSPAHRARVIHHEAGHFLVAHQLGIPVTGYTLNAWAAFRQGQPGLGGVQFDVQALDQQLAEGKLSVLWVDRFCTVWMAGGVAETLTYGDMQGGADDRQKLRLTLAQLQLSPPEIQQKERLAAIRAKELLTQHSQAFEALVAALEQQLSVEACGQVLQAALWVDGDK
jgi:hypothetical protein